MAVRPNCTRDSVTRSICDGSCQCGARPAICAITSIAGRCARRTGRRAARASHLDRDQQQEHTASPEREVAGCPRARPARREACRPHGRSTARWSGYRAPRPRRRADTCGETKPSIVIRLSVARCRAAGDRGDSRRQSKGDAIRTGTAEAAGSCPAWKGCLRAGNGSCQDVAPGCRPRDLAPLWLAHAFVRTGATTGTCVALDAANGGTIDGSGFSASEHRTPMAGKLLDGGHRLTIHDISDAAMRPLLERQARRATWAHDLADQCEIVFVSLPTLAAFRSVAFGPDGLDKGSAMKMLVNTCTIGVPFVKEIEQAMAARGVTVVDCPISAGRPARERARCRSWSPATARRSSASCR